MNNKLLEIQDMLMKEMKRLDNDNLPDIAEEVARGNALSQNATAFIKTINVGFRIIETSDKLGINKDGLVKQLGISNEK